MAPQRRQFTETDDGVVRAYFAGTISLMEARRRIGCGQIPIYRRAAQLGLRQPLTNGYTRPGRYSSGGPAVEPREPPINVGKDKLLARLQRAFGTPRTEVQPGSDRQLPVGRAFAFRP